MSYDLESTIEVDDVIVEFECPVCRCYMHPPIFQCKIGHSCCHNCSQKLPRCPTCRGRLSKRARSWRLEKIHAKLQFPCRNEDSGCDTIFPGKEIVSHELSCKFRTVKCPVRLSGHLFCEWEGTLSSSIRHFQDFHPKFFSTSKKQEFASEKFVVLGKIMSGMFISYFHVFEEFFIYSWSFDRSCGVIKWCVSKIETGSENTFDYVIETKPNPTSDKDFYIRARCPVVLNDVAAVYPSVYQSEHYDVIRDYCDGDDLKYTVTIIKN